MTDPGAAPAVEVRALTKSYGDHQAVRGVDLEINRGEIFALLGPNGAGKTTIVEILEGYRKRDGGSVRVLSLDPARDGSRLKSRIGIVLQSTGVEPYLTVRETVAMYAGYYPRPRPVDQVIRNSCSLMSRRPDSTLRRDATPGTWSRTSPRSARRCC